MAFDQIAAAVAAEKLAAGVMIHEELLYYPKLGLHWVADLGATWCQQNALPLPVGLNVIRRDLGLGAMQQICEAIRSSLRYGLDHAEETLARVSRFGRGSEGACTEQFVSMFANQDSLQMTEDARTALGVLLTQVVDLGYGETVPALDIIEARQPILA
jgi:1,4-dihydroxy-6-naphthoate synthase